ncbi:hypothetical protein F1188_16260 [Roseospira marina]|uniref:Ribbon-helix-helix protein, CopG family n=1 Tax=Roseospira marina TaxID=140057 RepID=A0A5M6I8A2_9PROT|nr:hypothetical protein [Roseospira marina]KAA5604413.1 hypothetical protein F1188_16260 [Roseospira marina]MBB4315394.1 hypothetical protein [Roseospira marina]MBB5088461.1 hypothetical protein [Roseospira marina]
MTTKSNKPAVDRTTVALDRTLVRQADLLATVLGMSRADLISRGITIMSQGQPEHIKQTLKDMAAHTPATNTASAA